MNCLLRVLFPWLYENRAATIGGRVSEYANTETDSRDLIRCFLGLCSVQVGHLTAQHRPSFIPAAALPHRLLSERRDPD